MSQSFKNQDASFLHALRRNCQLSIFKHLTKALLIMALLMPTIAFSQSEKISINLKNTSLEEVFNRIETLSGYAFIYDSNITDLDRKVNITAQDKSINAILTELFSGTDVEYTFSEKRVILKKKTTIAKSNGLVVKGKITSASGESLPAVNVIIKGTTIGVFADMDGNYSITIPDNIKDPVLRFAFMGYAEQELAVGSKGEVNVALADDISKLDESIVVGYGTVKKVSITSAVGSIKKSDINQLASNTTAALQGLTPGLTILDKGGAPGRSNATMRIRGTTTLNNSDALLLVDGIEQRISDLNPDDIESISILKDASATAIYGSRAANGVVLVTTKRGKDGTIKVDFNTYYGVQKSVNRPKHMDTETYMRQQNYAYGNAGRPIPYSEELIQTWTTSSDRIKYPLPNDWSNSLLKTAPQQNYNLTVSGGSEKVKGLMSLRSYDQDGVIPNFNSKIKEVRVNTDFEPIDKLKLSVDLNYRTRHSTTPQAEGEVYLRMMHASQFTVPTYADGGYGLSVQGHNPIMYAKMSGDNQQWNNLLVANIKAEYEIIDGLKASLQYASRGAYNKGKIYTNKFKVVDQQYAARSRTVARNMLEENREDISEYTFNGLLNYDKTIADKHHFKVLAGYSQIENKQSNLGASRQDFYNNDLESIDAGGESTMKNSGKDAVWALRSYFGRINYNYNDRYLFEANARYDGSSRFDDGKRYGFFPSFSGGWRISNESFWSGLVDIIPDLKIRASWGETGNQSAPLYSYYDSYTASSYTFSDALVAAYSQKELANKEIQWEKTTQTDIGLDVGLLKNKLTIGFDYYNKRTDGILISLPIPGTVGLNPPVQNGAIVDNKGFELMVNYKDRAGDLSYSFNFNISNNINKIVSLGGSYPTIEGAAYEVLRTNREGYAINTYWGYKTDGLYRTQADLDNNPVKYDPNTKLGDVKYLNLNGDNVIDTKDMTDLGNEFPKFPFAFNAFFEYKGFDLSFLIQGVTSASVRVTGALAEFGNYEGFVLDQFKDYWTPTNIDAKFPRPQKSTDYNSVMSDFWVINAKYIRLKNLQLGYTLPKEFTRKMKIEKVRFYIAGSNLLTFSPIKKWGLDPEFVAGRNNYYPQTSIYSIGANITF